MGEGDLTDLLCIHCGGEIALTSAAQAGLRVTCPACQAQLELINLNPPELDWAYDEPFGEYRRSQSVHDYWRPSVDDSEQR